MRPGLPRSSLLRLALLGPLAAGFPACSPSGDGSPSLADDAGPGFPPEPDLAAGGAADASPAMNADGSAASPVSCAGLTLPPQRDYTLKMEHGGLPRHALIHLPPGYDGSKPVGLVLNLHGSMCTAAFQAQMSHLDQAADPRGLVTVTPQGTGGMMPGWNAGPEIPMAALYQKVDDVAFLGALIDEVSRTICVDPQRVYCAGFSLGGSMCYRLAFELAHRIAAFASVAGPDAHPEPATRPPRALPMRHYHGTADTFATYEPPASGGANKGAEKTVSDYASYWGCSSTPQVTAQKGAVTCKTYSGCQDAAEATLCTIKDGGHTWPGGDGWILGGTVNQDIQASPEILDFFLAHPLP